MSSIFNSFAGTAESDNRGQMTKIVKRSKTSNEIRLDSLKTMGGAKPKGLSIRSNSDMNISHGPYPVNKKNIYSNKEQDYPKLKVTQIDSNGRPISPGKEIKKLIAQPSKCKESAAKEETTINKSTKIQLANDLFKKPIPVKKSTKIFPEPEKLAYWYDDQHEFDYKYIEIVEKEFRSFCKEKENIKPYKEEKKLISDPETPLLLEMPKLELNTSFDEEYEKLFSSDIPEVSDISDDDNS